MCSHYQGIKDRERYFKAFGVYPPGEPGMYDVWPGYTSTFIRRARELESGDEAVPQLEALAGQFGLLPHWAKDRTFARRTFNCRSETAATLPSFRDAWRRGQRCIVPAEAFFEPDWRSGKAVPMRIARADGEPMGIAGLWSWWKSQQGEQILSFTMLTVNADGHTLMQNFHKPSDEKRMVVILPVAQYDEWLDAPVDKAMGFMNRFPADGLLAHAGSDGLRTK